MNKYLLITSAFLLQAFSNAHAGEKYNHFPSLDAPNSSVALCNLAKFNQNLQAITKKAEISPEDMVKVHELTYTLENAVIRLQKELDTIAVDLEKVHKASEHLNEQVIKDSGEKYLAATKILIESVTCN